MVAFEFVPCSLCRPHEVGSATLSESGRNVGTPLELVGEGPSAARHEQ